MGEHTARDILEDIEVPALIIAAEFDAFTPPRLARALDSLLPDSELLWLEGASHAGIVEQPERINEGIGRFLEERVLPSRPRPKRRSRRARGAKRAG